MSSNRLSYTPSAIAEDETLAFRIPLYQRLFEWGDEQINQLLDDLNSAYLRDKSSSYYVGMLTAKETWVDKELVDGQQRFTAMILLGIYFNWDKFLSIETEGKRQPRLKFSAREEDQKYLRYKMYNEPCDYRNDKMEKALACIETHIHKELKYVGDKEKDFGKYIYEKLTFFLSILPEKYSSQELNTYFERMNTSGKSLENYEILKVDILSRLTDDKERYSNLWNAVSLMEKKILRKHTNESVEKLRGRYLNAILAMQVGDINAGVIEKVDAKFEIEDDYEEQEQRPSNPSEKPKSIRDIAASSENPFRINKRRTEEHSLLSFPEFLLQVLYISLGKDIEGHDGMEGMMITDFFDVRKLGQIFKWAFNVRGLDAKEYMNSLVKYRLIMDYFTIRIDDEDDEPYPFENYIGDEEQKGRVRQYMSMLYSASSAMTYYMWIPELFEFLDNYVKNAKNLDLEAKDYLLKLMEIDDNWHPRDSLLDEDLTYKTIDRYWFWRFDFYLWDNRTLFFTGDDLKTAVKYVFRRNRSIEHIAPQHPKDEFGDKTKFYWDDDEHPELVPYRDCLGNMVMVSSGQNSTLSNSCFEVKKAVMDRYNKGYGHVESLKMLYVYSKYRNEDWSIPSIEEHLAFSKLFLEATYDESKWDEVEKLHKQHQK